ncbi:MAG TPA: hypothetical protein VEV83_13145 [Parafilimonas sp.]|nr:hypothetical protein [Parafilimonas sp.]
MKRILIFELLFAAFLCNSCSKNSDSPTPPPPPPPSSLKVKTMTTEITASGSFHFLIVSTLSYDAQDRIIKVQSDSGYTNFSYQNNLVRKDIYQNGQPTQHLYYYLNSMSLLDSLITLAEGIPGRFRSDYYYNSKNQLIKIVMTSENAFGNFTDSALYEYNGNGDLTTITQGDNINSYEYFDKPNVENSSFMLYPGLRPGPHLLKTSSFTYMSDSNTTTYAYDFDEDGRIVTVTAQTTGVAYSQTHITRYTYY